MIIKLMIFLYLLSLFNNVLYADIASWQPYQLYLWAQYNVLEHQLDKADQSYTILQRLKHPYIYPGYLSFLFEAQQYDLLIKYATHLPQEYFAHTTVQLLLAQAYQQKKQFDKADQIMINLSHQQQDNVEILYHALQAHLRSSQFQEGIKLIDNYLSNHESDKKNFIFYFLRAQFNTQLGNTQQALENIQKSVQLHPEFEQGWLLLAIIQEMVGNIKQSITSYQKYLDLAGPQVMIQRHIAALLLQHQMHQPSQSNNLELAWQYFNEKNYPKALDQVNLVLEHNYHSLPLRILKIEILCNLHQFDELFSLLKQWIINDKDHDNWFRTIYLLYQGNINHSKIITLLQELLDIKTAAHQASLYLADIFIKEHHHDQALLYLQKALTNTQDNYIRTKIYYQIALIYFQQKKWELLYQTLELGRQEYQCFPPLLNLLAYYHATHTNDTQRAQELMRCVLQKDPYNPHFLDTQALIWYKQNKWSAAQQLLLQAVQKAPHDVYILKHLSKTLYKMGNYQQAHYTLKQAITYAYHDKKIKLQKMLQTWNIQ